MVLLACFPAFGQVATPPAMAIGSCDTGNDPARRQLFSACQAHPGCGMMLARQPDCARADGFIDRLKAGLAERTRITSNDVFEAGMPALTPGMTLEMHAVIVQSMVRLAVTDSMQGRGEFHSTHTGNAYYEGQMADGRFQGVGILIFTQGGMQRGAFRQGLLSGYAQEVTATGIMRLARDYRDNRRSGSGAMLAPGQMSGFGLWDSDRMVGVWEFTRMSGSTFKVRFGADGNELARGPDAPPGQTAREPADPSALAANASDDPLVVGGAWRR